MQNRTKKALFTSAVSLLLCIAMLVGSTFAWFTDSVTSGKNRIIAGNLDIEVSYYKDSKWVSIEDVTDLFTGNLWEPGHTEYATLKVENKGTLALKYNMQVAAASETAGTNRAGESFKLSDYLYFGTTAPSTVETTYADRDEARDDAILTKMDAANLAEATRYGNILASGQAQYVTLVVYMPESVGNEANYKTGTTPPEVDLQVTVNAAQYASEADSFDEYYDLLAPEVTVFSDAELQEAIDKVANNGTIIVGKELAAADVTFAAAKTVNLKGEKIDTLTVTAPNATVNVYNDVKNATVSEVAMNSVHFFNKVETLDAVKGHVVIEEGAEVGDITTPGTAEEVKYLKITVKGAADTITIPVVSDKITIELTKTAEVEEVKAEAATEENKLQLKVEEGAQLETKPEADVLTKPYIAQVGNTKYDESTTLAAVLGSVSSGETVTLLATKFDSLAVPAGVTVKGNSESGKPVTVITGAVSMGAGATIDGLELATGFNSASLNNATVKNCLFTGKNGIRWGYASGNVVIDNCEFATSTYGFHFDENSGTVTVKGSKICGFNTFSGNMVIENCQFTDSKTSAYRVCQTWGTMTIKNCSFAKGWVGGEAYVGNCQATSSTTFTGCTIEGTTVLDALKVWGTEAGSKNIVDGTEVYLISDVAGLVAYKNLVNGGNTKAAKATVYLTADIDMAGNTDWNNGGIGLGNRFGGTFDGQNHTISNFTQAYGELYGGGFFNDIIGGAVIKNVKFANANVYNTNCTDSYHKGNIYGIVCGYAYGAVSFENITVSDSAVTAYGKVAVILGMAADPGTHVTSFKNIKIVNTTVNGVYNVAGLCGTLQNEVSVTNCDVSGLKYTRINYVDRNFKTYAEATVEGHTSTYGYAEDGIDKNVEFAKLYTKYVNKTTEWAVNE